MLVQCEYDGQKKNREEADLSVRLGDIAPDFTASTTQGTIRFHDWIGEGWAMLMSHPADFTPVCTTELGYVASIRSEFDRRQVKVISLSVDTLESHDRWARDIEDTHGFPLNYPLIADPGADIARLYDMIHPNADDLLTVRSVFIIGPDKRIKASLTYPVNTGRNFDEILRLIDSLQLTGTFDVATPVNWRPGDDVIIAPTLSDAHARRQFPGGWTMLVKPYIRIVQQPGLDN